MEAADESTSVQKEWLKNTIINKTVLRYGLDTPYTAARFKISKFSKLEQNVKYRYAVAELKWDIKLTKTRKTVILEIYTEESFGTIAYAVVFSNNNFSKVLGVREAENCFYKIRISLNKIVDVDQNKLFKEDDILELQIRFDIRESRKIFHYSCQTVCCSTDDMVNISEDMLIARHKQRFFKNCTLDLDEEELKIDKAILAARCKFFRPFLKDREDKMTTLKMKNSKKAVHPVVTYIYTGKMNSLRYKVMTDVFKLAKDLEIRSLAIRTALNLKEYPHQRKFHHIDVKSQ